MRKVLTVILGLDSSSRESKDAPSADSSSEWVVDFPTARRTRRRRAVTASRMLRIS